jgi:hypothetical protein
VKTGIRFLLILLSMFVLSGVCLAQQPKKLEVAWLAKDVAAIQSIIPKLLSVESKNLEEIKATFPPNRNREGEDLGFGARKITFGATSGYTTLAIDLFTLNGGIQEYTIRVNGHSDSWPLIRSQLIDAWRKSGGPEFQETSSALSYHTLVDPDLQAYKRAVAAQLGQMKLVQIPIELKDDYEYLISPSQNSVVGSGGCGYAGVTPPGKKAIDALVNANRIDLIENVLRGFNPGGRVYAALALLHLKRGGLTLSDDTLCTINKVRDLNIPIEECAGCILFHRTAKEILKSPEQL